MLRIIKSNCPYCNNNIIANIDDNEFSSKYCVKCWKYTYLFGSHVNANSLKFNHNVIDIHKKLFIKKTN